MMVRVAAILIGVVVAWSTTRAGDGPPASAVAPAPAAAASAKTLAPPKTLPLGSGRPANLPPRRSTGGTLDRATLSNMAASLGIVLGLLVVVVWVLKRSAPKSATVLPKEAFEVLGRATLAGRQQAQLVRCGRKLLLVALTPGGAETLTEITDPAEVDHLAGLCQQEQSGSQSQAFRQLLQQFAREKPGDGFLGTADEQEAARQEVRRG